MENNKKTVVYARTSTKKQNYELQLEAAKPFLKDIQEENLILIVDHCAPATSKPKGLQQLLDLIKEDQVDTLIIFKRDRLTRSEDEYLDILKSIYANGIKVVLTAEDSLPFNHDQKSGFLFESLIIKVINMEKTNMSIRIKAGLKMKQA
jgi:DNA invertase Pin-like site-specific DNA recombinase